MPIYDYKCEHGHQFEVLQKFSDDPLTECQECGAPVQKVLHPPAIHFKGSGFHNTDYGTRKGNAEKAAKKDSSSSDSGSSSSESKSSDSKSSDSKSSDSKTSTSSSSSSKSD